MHPTVAKTRARVAGLHGRPTDDPDRVAAKREFIAAKTAAYIEKVLESWPPLTDEQLTKLAELLKPVRRSAAITALRAEGGGHGA